MARRAARSAAVPRADALSRFARRTIDGRRAFAAGLLSALMLSLVWVRSEPWTVPIAAVLEMPVTVDLPVERNGFVREGLWQLDSAGMDFGGYSAMLTVGEHELRLFSDRGSWLTFPLPDTSLPPRHPRRASFSRVWNIGPFSDEFADIESATRHPDTRDYWLGFENFNAVARYDRTGRFIAARQPPEMRHWPVNGGLEAMTRLADGRFLLLPESRLRGLLFSGDPAEEGATALVFRFALPDPYYATGMVLLPDGRVLVLARGLQWGWLPFTARLYVGDPAQIGEREPWQLEEVLDLDMVLPSENWEALAITPLDDGSIRIWIASDDNFAALQRTLLAKLRWTPRPP